jgi:hypothetical protein
MTTKPTFSQFYNSIYISEHTDWRNKAFHIFGTITSTLLILVVVLQVIPAWSLLLWPIVNIAPGLIGHRLFERVESVGDLRINRKDVPRYYFILGNYILTWKFLTFKPLS